MKKITIVFALFILLFSALVYLFISDLDSKSPNNNNESNTTLGKDITQKISTEYIVTVDDMQVELEEVNYSKKIKNIPIPPYIDSSIQENNGEILSKHFYLYVVLKITNLKDTDNDISLNNISLNIKDKNKKYIEKRYELWSSNINVDNYLKRDFFHCNINRGESKRITFVYVVNEDDISPNYNFLLNVNLSGVGRAIKSNGTIEDSNNRIIDFTDFILEETNDE